MQEQLSEHLQTQPNIEYEKLVTLIQDNIAKLKAQLEVRDGLKLKLELHQQNLAKQQNTPSKFKIFNKKNIAGAKFQA